MQIIYENGQNKSLMFDDLGGGLMVQTNQHVIIKNGEAMVLDPGGHKIYTRLFSEISPQISTSKIKYVFFSHQDPDIIAAANGWLMVTDAVGYISKIWLRFLPHFGIDKYVEKKIKPIPDNGMKLELGGAELLIIPAHFLHSCGNFMIYDPETKILYSGDLGASLGAKYNVVENFEDHLKYIETFHERYIPSSRPLQIFLNTVSELDIETVAPQHGAIYQGKLMVNELFSWLGELKCGFELMPDKFELPG